MTRSDTFRQANAFAMVDGLKFGLYWCLGFFCVVRGLGGTTLATLGMLIVFSAPFIGIFLARKFESQVRNDAPVGFGRAYLYSALTYLYASAILAIVSFAYFNWLDHGSFINNYIAVINSPDMQSAIRQAGLEQVFSDTAKQNGFSSFEELLRSIRPVDISASLFNLNTFAGLILSLPTALLAITHPRNFNKGNNGQSSTATT